MLLEHDDLSDVYQPQEESSSHAAEDELQHREGWWWLVLVVTREDHPLGIDGDTVGSSITAPVSTSAHVVLLDQGLSQQAAPKDGTLTRTPRARGRQASLWNRRLGPLCGEGRVARKSRRGPVYPVLEALPVPTTPTVPVAGEPLAGRILRRPSRLDLPPGGEARRRVLSAPSPSCAWGDPRPPRLQATPRVQEEIELLRHISVGAGSRLLKDLHWLRFSRRLSVVPGSQS